jgi:hypothetical protein
MSDLTVMWRQADAAVQDPVASSALTTGSRRRGRSPSAGSSFAQLSNLGSSDLIAECRKGLVSAVLDHQITVAETVRLERSEQSVRGTVGCSFVAQATAGPARLLHLVAFVKEQCDVEL